MIFSRYGVRWTVDEFGALWFEVPADDGLVLWGERRMYGSRWLRTSGIDL